MRHDFKTLFDLYDYASSKYARRTAAQFTDGGQSYTYVRHKESCENLSRILSNFGIGAFDKVAILSENMPHWGIAFFAVTAYGRIAVPMLNELSSSEVDNILEHSEAKALFVSRRQLKKVSERALSRLSLIIDMENFEFIKHDDAAFTCDGRVATPNPMDMAALIYTSGTTGAPKGVMLSHRNFCASVLDSWYAQPENKKSVFLSILPMAHTYEMTLGLLYPYSVGARVCYLQRIPTPTVLKQTLKEVRPTTILSVPLIIEKIHKLIRKKVAEKPVLAWMDKHTPGLLCKILGFQLNKNLGGKIKFFGIGTEEFDHEGRVITLEFDRFYLITVYVPNSQDGLKRLDWRMQWEDAFLAYIKELDQKKPVIYCGDLNVAHQEIDIRNPSSNRRNAGFTDEERGKMSVVLSSGFVDSFRYFYPDATRIYSWWSYRFHARENNTGWRIDYFICSESLTDALTDSRILTDIYGSDHCPVELDIEL